MHSHADNNKENQPNTNQQTTNEQDAQSTVLPLSTTTNSFQSRIAANLSGGDDQSSQHKITAQLLKATDNSFQSRMTAILRGVDDQSPQHKITTQLRSMFEDNQGTSQGGDISMPPNNTGLPDNLKTGIEHLSGMSLDDVKVHYNSDKPAQLQAHAYAQGTDIHLAPGQQKHLPHEAWHVVQQKQGRVQPTMQMKGKVNVNDDTGLEKEADVMGERALQMNPKENKSRAVADSVAQKKCWSSTAVIQCFYAECDNNDPDKYGSFTDIDTKEEVCYKWIPEDRDEEVYEESPRKTNWWFRHLYRKKGFKAEPKGSVKGKEGQFVEPTTLDELYKDIDNERFPDDRKSFGNKKDYAMRMASKLTHDKNRKEQNKKRAILRLSKKYESVSSVSPENGDQKYEPEQSPSGIRAPDVRTLKKWLESAKGKQLTKDESSWKNRIAKLYHSRKNGWGKEEDQKDDILRYCTGSLIPADRADKKTEGNTTAKAVAFKHDDPSTWTVVNPIKVHSAIGDISNSAEYKAIRSCSKPGNTRGRRHIRPQVDTRMHCHFNAGSSGLSFIYKKEANGSVTPIIYDIATGRGGQNGNEYRWLRDHGFSHESNASYRW